MRSLLHRSAAALALAIVAALTSTTAAHAQRPAPRPTPAQPASPAINSVRVSIETGNDDLREASEVIAEVRYRQRGATRTASVSMNSRQGWGPSSENARTIRLPAGTRLSDIRGIRVYFRSGQRNIFDSPDNWDMSSITVVANGAGGPYDVLQEAGSPLRRFQSDDGRPWEMNVNLR